MIKAKKELQYDVTGNVLRQGVAMDSPMRLARSKAMGWNDDCDSETKKRRCLSTRVRNTPCEGAEGEGRGRECDITFSAAQRRAAAAAQHTLLWGQNT